MRTTLCCQVKDRLNSTMTLSIVLLFTVLSLTSVICDVTVVRPLPRARGVYVDGYGGPGYGGPGYGGPGFVVGDWDDNGYLIAGDYSLRGLSVLPPYVDGYDGGYVGVPRRRCKHYEFYDIDKIFLCLSDTILLYVCLIFVVG
ncbi:hypothetical protein Btru_027455 [Bulinus truncatus]|nr:hypothetical protein Btru_027455 [Bulinus truncatus]